MLDVLKNEYLSFLAQLIKTFDDDSNDLVSELSSLYLNNLKLLKIVSIYLTDIEIHSSLEKLVDFKATFVNEFPKLLISIQKRLNISNEKASFLFNSLLMLTHGLYPMICPTQNQIEAMKQVGMPLNDNPYEYCYNHLFNIIKE